MNDDIYQYTKQYIDKTIIQGKTILEIGSLNVNGTIRYYLELLEPSFYLGIDMISGDCVDMICDITKLKLFHKFDIIICHSVLEHICNWKKAVNNMKNNLKPNGLIYISVPDKEFHYHGFPYDWWRYSQQDMLTIFSDFEIIRCDKINMIVLMIAKKPKNFKLFNIDNYKLFSILNSKSKHHQNQLDLLLWGIKNWKYLLRKLIINLVR